MNKEIPSSYELLPDPKRIADVVCRFYGVKTTKLPRSVVEERMKREVLPFILPENCGWTLTRKLVVITELITTGRSGVCVRMSKELSENKDLAGKIKRLKKMIETSQERT